MNIGERIKYYREQKGMTQEEVALHLGTTPQNIYKYEKGIVTNIPLARIEGLAALFGVSPFALTDWQELSPTLTEEIVSFPVVGEIAAGYNHIALEDSYSADNVEIPLSYLKGRPRSDFFVLRVTGDSMYPLYMDGDKVLIKKTPSLERSGEIGAVLYEDYATLKKVEYVVGEDWMKLIPVNPQYQPKTIEGADLEQCKILGVPTLLVREIN